MEAVGRSAGTDHRTFTPDRRSAGARVSLNEPAVVVVDPDADESKRPGALDDQVQVAADTVDVAGYNPQSARFGGDVERTRSAPSVGIKHNSIAKALQFPAFGFDRDSLRAAAAIEAGTRAARNAEFGCRPRRGHRRRRAVHGGSPYYPGRQASPDHSKLVRSSHL